MNFEEQIQNAVNEIRTQHDKIIDDWCKAYMAQRHQEGKSIDVGSFTLCQQNLSWEQNKCGFRYWFEDGKPNYPRYDGWISVKDRLPEPYDFVLVFADNEGTGEPRPMSIARWEKGSWGFVNNTPLMCNQGAWMDIEYDMDSDDVTHWMPLPLPPKD